MRFCLPHPRGQTADQGKKAGLKGVRYSPHTLRHTAAVKFLRDVAPVACRKPEMILPHSGGQE